MNLRPQRKTPIDINLTPLIDVVFLLLIFFMVSTSFKDEARLRVQLPEAEGVAAPAEEPPETLTIVIDAEGVFFIGERRVLGADAATLGRAIAAALAGRDSAPVLIQADARTPHQAVMTALDATARQGLNQVAFAATRNGEAP
ncbi:MULTISPECIES: biopolymer transporter ExbD [Marichromatium]|uniref:Biopolymer transport protein ExbD n=1 Tax=Marichromatium gracile TaxID=1048 RepID=A0A4R4A772_MARGR|nr:MULTISPECIES: biopolymer transporter ExbD [Marichromatium]MBO8087299.1 biopolymer transporter ExbD [Marichromatium sp.]MBK1708694.1 biopolymer transporter ExbD [Marichromatium gracile]RNE91062.1 biopolymer transporter ExbD [Marichromatium sp. AB31]RNE93731.1 biopolymer transporter ExbD [Marichromatium sp. AB32]TCW34306.1 biopolymer transport protein ExbD [Marichromatium gracile]